MNKLEDKMDRDEAYLNRDGIPKHLIINIKKLKFTNRELGRGSYGRIFTVKYCRELM